MNTGLRSRLMDAIPPVLLRGMRAVRASAYSFQARGDAVECPLCSGTFSEFLYRRGQMLCPRCRSLPRHRKLWLFFERSGLLERPTRLLHFAPEPQMQRRLLSVPSVDYVSADLFRRGVTMKLDLTAIDLPDDDFDAVICVHVLEHVTDDDAAMRELRRVTKPGGWAIIDVPVQWDREETFEDWSVTDPRGREKVFGQSDHVRIYGRTYPERLRRAGWNVELHPLEFTDEERARFGLNTAPIYFCRP
jgi:SAM-dependent methyltransferase